MLQHSIKSLLCYLSGRLCLASATLLKSLSVSLFHLTRGTTVTLFCDKHSWLRLTRLSPPQFTRWHSDFSLRSLEADGSWLLTRTQKLSLNHRCSRCKRQKRTLIWWVRTREGASQHWFTSTRMWKLHTCPISGIAGDLLFITWVKGIGIFMF